MPGVQEVSIGHALVARYDPGAGIGWHRDRPVFDQVVGISLGAPAVLRFRQRSDDGFRRAGLKLVGERKVAPAGPQPLAGQTFVITGEELRFCRP